MGGVQNSSRNSGGVGGYFGQKMEIPRRGGGGGSHEIPSVVGVWIFSGTTQYHLRRASYTEGMYILLESKGNLVGPYLRHHPQMLCA